MSAHFRPSILLLATLTLWRASAAGCLASTRGWTGFHGAAGLLPVVLNGCPALLPGMGPLRLLTSGLMTSRLDRPRTRPPTPRSAPQPSSGVRTPTASSSSSRPWVSGHVDLHGERVHAVSVDGDTFVTAAVRRHPAVLAESRETRRGGAPRPPSPSGPHCGGSRSRGLVFRFSSRPDRKAAVSVPRERAAPAASPRAPQRRRRCLSGPDRSWPSSSVEAAGRVGAEGDLGPSGLVQSRTEGLGPGEAHVSKGNQKE